jgi:integrase
MRCRVLSNGFDQFIASRSMLQSLPPAEVHAIARDYFQTCLNQALEWSLDLPGDGTDIDSEVELMKADMSVMRDALKQKKFAPAMVAKADELLTAHISPDRKVDADTRLMMREAVTRAHVAQLRFLTASLSGNFEETAIKDPIFAGMKPNGFPAFENLQDKETAPSFAQACEAFIAARSKTWVGKTKNDYRRVLDLAQAIIGPARKLALISTNDVKDVRDGLAKLPKNAAKFSCNEGLSLVDLIHKKNAGEPISGKTQDKYFAMFRGFLKWALDEELLPKMPGPAIKVVRSKNEDDIGERLPYSREQLAAIFVSPVFTGCKSDARRSDAGSLILRDGKFWMPLVALYSGMRMGEIAQLLVADVRVENEILYFDVNKDEDKTLKTSASRRRVPVHAALLEAGFGEYVASLKAKGMKRLFPDLKPGADGYYSHNFSKWWGRYGKAVGFHTPKTVFHSFRHNFKDALYAADVSETAAHQLMGHKDNSPHAGYGTGLPLQNLKAAIDRIDYKIDLGHMKQHK